MTRSPCTEGGDGHVFPVMVAQLEGMSDDNFKFLNSRCFGVIIFPLCDDPLPSKIAGGDLDGDRYFVLWDNMILDHLRRCSKIPRGNTKDILPDDLAGTFVKHQFDNEILQYR